MNSTLQHIVRRCQVGDELSQREIYDLLCSDLFRVAFRYVWDEHTCQDILQESFIRIFKHIHKVRVENDKEIIGWMKRIVINESLRWIKKNKKHRHVSDSFEEQPSLFQEQTLDVELVIQYMSRMPERYRIVFSLHAIDGFSHAEIGEKLNIKESTSRSQLTRARQYLQNKLKNINVV